MKSRRRNRPRWTPTAVAALTALAACGCFPDLHGMKIMYPAAGEAKALMFADDYCSPGGVLMPLPPKGEVVLEGEWTQIGDATDLHAVVIGTPDGPVTVADLADSGRPETIAELSGDGIEMICVCSKDAREHEEVTCADSLGGRWSDRELTERRHLADSRELR
jgi:hypothetical protein